jgi:hypothetical protein
MANSLFTKVALATLFAASLVGLPQPAQAAGPAWPEVAQGAVGPNVKTIQLLLIHRGHAIPADGIFGTETRSAVIIFQRNHGLVADGVVGPQTWPELVIDLEPGMSGDHVRAGKVQLNKHDGELFMGPNFTDDMAEVVRFLKVSWGLANDPTLGHIFWRYLLGRDGLPANELPIPEGSVSRGELDNPHHDYPAIDIMVEFVPLYAPKAGIAFHYHSGTCGDGIRLFVTGSSTNRFVFCHLSARSVGDGVSVAAGARIGTTGESGNAVGNPHLHIEIRTGAEGTLRCPQQWLLAVYDHRPPPALFNLTTTGCFFLP